MSKPDTFKRNSITGIGPNTLMFGWVIWFKEELNDRCRTKPEKYPQSAPTSTFPSYTRVFSNDSTSSTLSWRIESATSYNIHCTIIGLTLYTPTCTAGTIQQKTKNKKKLTKIAGNTDKPIIHIQWSTPLTRPLPGRCWHSAAWCGSAPLPKSHRLCANAHTQHGVVFLLTVQSLLQTTY